MNIQSQSEHKTRCFAKGDFLCRQGEISRDLYIIRYGEIRIFKTEGGVEVELDRLGPGAVVGEISAIDGEARSASVIALVETEAVVIAGDEFARVVAGFPDWFSKISRILVQRLREVDSKIDFSKGGDKSAHSAALISLMCISDQCTRTGDLFYLPAAFVESELVTLLNMQDSEASEVLGRLAKEGLISIDKGRLVVKSPKDLEVFGESAVRLSDGTLSI